MPEQMHIVTNVHNPEQFPKVVGGGVVAAIVVAKEMAEQSYCDTSALPATSARIAGMTFAQSTAPDSPSRPRNAFDIALRVTGINPESEAQSRTYRYRITPMEVVTVDKPYIHFEFGV